MMPLIQVPLLSEHSFNLVRNRLLETIFGGITFFFSPDIRVSKWALIIQLGIHQMPFIFGAVFTALVEAKMCSLLVSSCVCGILVTLLTLILHLTCLLWTNKSLYQHQVELKEVDQHSVDKIKIGSLDISTSEQSSEQMSMEDLVFHLFPKKKWKINYIFHAICNGLLCGYGVSYLLPTTLNFLYRQAIISYTIYFVGWQTICVTAFSLTAHPPPETATYTVLDPYELKPLMRPFYIGLCYVVDIVCRLNFTLDSIPNAAVHLLLTFIPLMWFLNVFPPLDALFIWLLEQVHVWLVGGSPFSSRNFLGLILHLLIWSSIVVGVYFLPKHITLLISAVLGYVLSLDLVTIWRSFNCGRNKSSAWDILDLVFFAALLIAASFLSIVMFFLITPNSFQITDTVIFAFGIVLLILYIVIVITSSSQRIYFLFGLLRNCIYPRNLQTKTFLGQSRLQTLCRIRSAVIMIVTPLVLIVFITLSENLKIGEKYSKLCWINLLRIVAILRAFRWTWQQTESALFEVLISFFILRYTKLLNFIGSSSVVYLLMSVIVDRVLSVKSKCQLVCLLLVTNIFQEKQRRPYSCLLFVLNVAFYPLVFALILVAAILSAPLLALYTLPIFWIGFPRPTSFWPKQEREENDCAPDSIYYEEVVPNLIKALNLTFSSGALGNVKTGDHFILRFESRLIWLTIAEHGFGYYNVMLKGLELQQTSCHAMEATTVDEILEWAFEVEDPSCIINRNLFHVFSPKLSMLVETYVDSRNVLTGVIDSPDALQIISNYFPKCLIWALLKSAKAKKESYKIDEDKITESSLNLEKQIVSGSLIEEKESKYDEFRESSTSILVEEVDEDDPWKDEKDLLGSPPPSIDKKKRPENFIFNDLMVWSDLEMNSFQSENLNMFCDKEISLTETRDFSPLSISKSCESVFGLSEREMTASYFPNEWLKTPLSPDIFQAIQTEFPHHWFQFAFKNCSELVDDSKPTDCELKVYQHLVLSCHYIVNQLVVSPDKRVTSGIHPSAVNRIFQGELPWSSLSEWLTQNTALFKIVVLAFRYAFKIALDHILLNDIENESDLKTKLCEFERFWFIGPKEDPDWTSSIRKHVPNLFTLSFNSEKYTYSSHLLTRRNIPIYIGSLNRDAVSTIWTTLNLELLYLANDDEERYSIQAHSSLLRNLTIQAADPPLGYPIYMTKPILVKAIPTLLMLCR